MIRTRVWPVRAVYMFVAFALVISLMITAAPPQTVSAADGTLISEWDRVDTPTTEDWVLAPGSIIIDYAVPNDGEWAYAIVNGWNPKEEESGTWLLKSTDHAATWKDITKGVKKEIAKVTKEDEEDVVFTLLNVACDLEDPSFLAVAVEWDDGSVHVLLSSSGGTSFRDTGKVEDDAAVLPTGGILDFAIAPEVKGTRNLAIGGTAAGKTVLFRCLAIGDIGTGWNDATLYDGWDDENASAPFHSAAVVDIHFAPSWATDNTILVATVTVWGADSTVHLQSGTWGTVEAWNDDAGFTDAVPIISNVHIPAELQQWAAGINTPSDYTRKTADRYAWVNVNYWDPAGAGKAVGRIYRVINKNVIAIDTQVTGEPWLSHVSYVGTIPSGKAIASLLGNGEFASYGCYPDDLLADCCEGVQVYRNNDISNMDICCLAWDDSCKPPSGMVAVEAFYVNADKAYAVAVKGLAHDEGAWSWSFDDGEIWNQLSLIDTSIDYLSDVAVSPNCNKTMLVSINEQFGCGCDSVWYRAWNLDYAPEYSGKWLRTWYGELKGEDCWGYTRGLLRLAPEEENGETVYLVDMGTGTVYWNEMQTLGCWEAGTSTVDRIVDLAVKDKDTIYALGDNGEVAMSDGHGDTPTWHDPVDSKAKEGHTIAVHGDHILVGGKNGEVSHSDDGGETFTQITEPLDAKLPIPGWVTVAFDSYFDTNNTIYAAVYDLDGCCDYSGDIYRWIAGESTKWYNLGARPRLRFDDGRVTEQFNVAYTGLVLDNADGNPMTSPATGGVLYASFVGYHEGEDYWVTGVARLLTPAKDFCCDDTDWDYLHVGLTWGKEGVDEFFEAMPKALKICGCLTPDSNSKLFAIDDWSYYDMDKGREGAVWTFEDCVAKSAPTLRTPADGMLVPDDGCCEILPLLMEWSRLCDACNYQIEIALDSDFTQGVMRFPEDVFDRPAIRPIPATAPSWMFRDTDLLSPGTTYYWRIRSLEAETGQRIRSWWSAPRSFTTGLFAGTGVTLISPEPGATDVARTNLAFVWSASAEVDSYNWVLSPNDDLSGAVDQYSGPNPTYTFTNTLSADTSYYWRVQGVKGGAVTSEATGTFRTAATEVYCSPQSGLCFNTEAELREHHEQLQKDAMKTPVWVWVVIAIGAVLVIVVIVLIFRTRRV